MSNCGVYLLTNTVSGRVYVGQSKALSRRWRAHLRCVRAGVKTKLYDAIRSYGETAFAFSVLEICEVSELNSVENKWIAHYDAVAAGYNMIATASHGRIVCPETRERMAAAQRGKVLSAAHKEAISAALLRAGHRPSAEASAKSAAVLTGRTISDATRSKMRDNAQRLRADAAWGAAMQAHNKPWTEERRRAASEQRRGRTVSAETRAKISATRRALAARSAASS